MKEVASINKNQQVINADDILEKSKGVYNSAIILGYNTDDNLEARCTSNMSGVDVLWLIEQFKLTLLAGEDQVDG